MTDANVEPDTHAWRAIPGYEGAYSVSDMGQVRSEPRVVTFGSKTRNVLERILSFNASRSGYLSVTLSRPEGPTTFFVHRLVLLAFVGPCPEGLEVRHMDGNRHNNAATNLVYGTKSENQKDRVRHGTSAANRTHCKNGHEFTESNTYIRSEGHRMCRTCRQESSRRVDAKRKADRAVKGSGNV